MANDEPTPTPSEESVMADEPMDPPPAEATEHFQALDVTQTGLGRYAVADREAGEVHNVTLAEEIACSCGALPDGDAACNHAMYVIYKASNEISADVHALRQVATLQTRVVDALQRAESGGGSSTSSSRSESDADEPEPEPVDPDGDAEELLYEFDAWLPQAVKFDPEADESAFNIEIVDLKWAEFEGEEGIWIDTAPFGTEYWDSDAGDWANKDGFQAAREALVEVLQKRDEVGYSGPPHYVNFVAEDDVTEVVG